jgi:diguanylate cyclase (GGDEF)-like protein
VSKEPESAAEAVGPLASSGPIVHMTRDALGVITSIDTSVFELLGWRPEQLVGSPSTNFIHSVDQPSAVAAWMDMMSVPGCTRMWRGRYKTGQGAWKWVETENRFDDTDVPMVISSMKLVSPEHMSLEEQLQAREQLLNRLSDALPVGIFQVDLERRITLTNNSFHQIVDVPSKATFEEQLATVLVDDRPALNAALAQALADHSIDNVEIRVRVPNQDSAAVTTTDRVCLLSLRPLTDGAGVVSGAVGCLSDVTERALLHEELEVRASTDKLTSCLNRAATIELVDQTINNQRVGVGSAVIFIDLDRLKSVNDALGHAAGDHLLVVTANRVKDALRQGDFVGRLGGDEFLVICPSVASAAQAVEIAERISMSLTTSVVVGSATVDLRASVGVAWTTEALDTDTLIGRADSAMYESKRLGRHGVTLFSDDESHRGSPDKARRRMVRQSGPHYQNRLDSGD